MWARRLLLRGAVAIPGAMAAVHVASRLRDDSPSVPGLSEDRQLTTGKMHRLVTSVMASVAKKVVTGAFAVPPGPHVEPFTDLSFPDAIESVPGSPGPVLLTDVSIRCMMGYCHIAQARAYAYALYVDAGPAQVETLRPFAAASADTLTGAPTEAMYDAAVAMPGAKVVYLQFARAMSPAHIAKGFDRTLVKLVRHEHGGERRNATKPALRELIGYFAKQPSFEQGSQVLFSVSPDGAELSTVIDGELKGTIRDPALCRAMLKMYLGSRPVSAEGKKRIGRGLLRLIDDQADP